MLADPEALRAVIGTNVPARELGLTHPAHQVESVPDPQETLKQTIARALAQRRKRRRRIDLTTLYEPLARRIDLDLLKLVPAYQRFVDDITSVLVELRLAL